MNWSNLGWMRQLFMLVDLTGPFFGSKNLIHCSFPCHVNYMDLPSALTLGLNGVIYPITSFPLANHLVGLKYYQWF